MPERTAITTLTVTVEVRDEVNAFIKVLASQEGCDTTQGQLIAALVHGTTPGLAAYMVGQYVRYKASAGASDVPRGGEDKERARTLGVRVRWTCDRYTSFSEVDGFVKSITPYFL
jgi:hypothetical protein